MGTRSLEEQFTTLNQAVRAFLSESTSDTRRALYEAVGLPIPTDLQVAEDPQSYKVARGILAPDLRIYTDGGAWPNPGGPGGYGIVVTYKGSDRTVETFGGESSTTNNRMEIMAAIRALEYVIAFEKPDLVLEIVTDSQYLMNCAQGKWKRKSNLDIWADWDRVVKACKAKEHTIRWEWVRGHNGDPYNERADSLATQGRIQELDSSETDTL